MSKKHISIVLTTEALSGLFFLITTAPVIFYVIFADRLKNVIDT